MVPNMHDGRVPLAPYRWCKRDTLHHLWARITFLYWFIDWFINKLYFIFLYTHQWKWRWSLGQNRSHVTGQDTHLWEGKCIMKMNSHLSGLTHLVLRPGPRFNIKISSYQYRKSHCGDKTVVRSSYLLNGISYTGKMSSLYWIGALIIQGVLGQYNGCWWAGSLCCQVISSHKLLTLENGDVFVFLENESQQPFNANDRKCKYILHFFL